MADGIRKLGWWTISGEALLDMMRRCAAGEDPDMVYAEEYVNAQIEVVPPADTEEG